MTWVNAVVAAISAVLTLLAMSTGNWFVGFIVVFSFFYCVLNIIAILDD